MWISFRCKSGGLVDHFWVQFNKLSGSHRNGWPDDTETTVRITPKWVAGRYRNDWPDHTEMGVRMTPKYAFTRTVSKIITGIDKTRYQPIRFFASLYICF